MNIYNHINDLHLSVGETKRTNCPSCNGYKTFTVTNNMGRLVWNCYKSSCPFCYKHGWAVREAGRIEHRTKKASKKFGLAEHIVLSVPVRDYHLSSKALRRKAVEVAKKRGVIGGCLIFHGFRYRPHRGWYWSPHFHCIGFVLGGYAGCRNCERKSNCDSRCNGFDSRAWKLFNKDGWYVKVLGKRKTIGGTAWYQLNHASVRRGANSKKSHVATWWGVCSYRKLKLINGSDVGIRHKCPVCGKDLVRLRYLGVFSEISISRRGELVPMFDGDGEPLWEIVVDKKFSGGG